MFQKMRKKMTAIISLFAIALGCCMPMVSNFAGAEEQATDKEVYKLVFEDDFNSDELKEEWTGVVGAKAGGDAEFGYEWYFDGDKAIVFNGDLTGDMGKLFMGEDSWRNYVVELDVRGAMMNAGIGIRATETDTFDCEFRGLLVCFDTGNAGNNFIRLGALSNPGWNDLYSVRLPDSFDENEFHNIRIFAIEDNIKVFVDDVKYIDLVVPHFPTGKVGFRAYAFENWINEDVTFDNFKVYMPTEEQNLPTFALNEVFSDSFDETTFNADNRYKILDNATTEIVEENGNKVLKYSGENPGGFLYDTGNMKNYAVSLKIKSSNSNAGILMRAQNTEAAESISAVNAFAGIFDAYAKCWRVANYTESWPDPIQLNIAQKGYLGADYVEIKIVLVEDYLQVFLDGDTTPLVSGRTNTFIEGPAGFRFVPWLGGDVYIDDFKVYEVTNANIVDKANEDVVYETEIAISEFVKDEKRMTSGNNEWLLNNGNTLSLEKDNNSATVYSEEEYGDVNTTAKMNALNHGALNAGIIFRAELSQNPEIIDPVNAYFVCYDDAVKMLSLGKFEAGSYKQLAYTKIFEAGEFTVTVKTDNDKIMIYLNDRLTMIAVDESFKSGYVGIKAYTEGGFDAASVELVSIHASTVELPEVDVELKESTSGGNTNKGDNTQKGEKKRGCKGSISTSSVLFVLLGIGAVTFIRLKKNDQV